MDVRHVAESAYDVPLTVPVYAKGLQPEGIADVTLLPITPVQLVPSKRTKLNEWPIGLYTVAEIVAPRLRPVRRLTCTCCAAAHH